MRLSSVMSAKLPTCDPGDIDASSIRVTRTGDNLITVAIVEDDPAVRQSLMGILGRAPGVKCVGAFGSAEEALEGIPPNGRRWRLWT